jgi:hypothetical protein
MIAMLRPFRFHPNPYQRKCRNNNNPSHIGVRVRFDIKHSIFHIRMVFTIRPRMCSNYMAKGQNSRLFLGINGLRILSVDNFYKNLTYSDPEKMHTTDTFKFK